MEVILNVIVFQTKESNLSFLPAEKLIYNQLTYHLPNNFKHNKLKDSETYHFNSVFENKKKCDSY